MYFLYLFTDLIICLLKLFGFNIDYNKQIP